MWPPTHGRYTRAAASNETTFARLFLRVNRLGNGCLMVCRCHDDTHRCHIYHIAQRDWLLISCADVNE